MRAFLGDLRQALRLIRKSPGFVAATTLTLALGIGANTAIFSVVDTVLLRPLPYAEPERILFLNETEDAGRAERFEVSYPNFVEWRAQAQSFEAMAAYRSESLILTGAGAPARLSAVRATPELFPVLGAAPATGRALIAVDDRVGAAPVAILGHAAWQKRFGGDPTIVGKTLVLDRVATTIVGVMPAGFEFPEPGVELWLPLGDAAGENRAVHTLGVVGRLRAGAGETQALAELDAISRRVVAAHPGEDPGHHGLVTPLHEVLVGNVRPVLLVLFAAVGFVLLIACANAANLLLARAAGQRREMAIRAALGATRWRRVQKSLAESLVLGLLGGTAGLLLALWCVDVLASGLVGFVPRAQGIVVDGRVLGFTLAASLATALFLGAVPAYRAARLDVSGVLRQAQAPLDRNRARTLLVVAQAAVSVLLLAGAGLMLRSVWLLRAVDPGFRPEGLMTLSVTLTDPKYDDAAAVAFFEALPGRLEAVPGVASASATSRPPLSGGDGVGSLTVEGRNTEPEMVASYRRILPSYFRTLGVPLVRGRFFDAGDRGGTKVVLVNDSLARRLWPGGDAVGKRIKVGPAESEPWLTVVGVVGDVANVGLDRGPLLATYEPLAQRPRATMTVVVRAAVDPRGLKEAVASAIRAADPGALIEAPALMTDRVSASIADRKIELVLLCVFAAVGVLLAALGVFAVMSFLVAQRTREIGIRMALGADRQRTVGLVLWQGLRLLVPGIGLGLLASLALTRFIAHMLFQVTATDPPTLVAISLVLLGAGMAACALPALRATRIDPMVALRSE